MSETTAPQSTDEAEEAPDHTGEVIVGVDGSGGSEVALRWALDRTDRYGPVVPVHSWDYPAWTYAPSPFGPGGAPAPETMARSTEAAIGDYLEALEPGLSDRLVLRWGSPAGGLIAESATAELLVVGTRGHGALTSRFLGSVSLWCAHHTQVPMAIVPEGSLGTGGTDRVAVGIDGSANSEDALRWALRHHADGPITVYGAWQSPIAFGYEQAAVNDDMVAQATEELVHQSVATVCADVGVDTDTVKVVITDEGPRRTLHEASDQNDVLVIGARGRTGFEYLMLGSTTSALVVRPHCATVVVPHDQTHPLVEES